MKFKKILLTIAALCGFFIAGKAEATCSNFTTYSDGQVLTASSLNSLQTNYTNCVNGILDGDTFTGNMLWYSGNDALFYSDSGSTLKAAIYGDGAAAIVSNTNAGSTTNCEIGVSGTTLTISGSGGVALSATNPCIIAIRKTTGVATPVYFTANVTVTFGATSNTDGNLFGLTDVNWANNMPFFLGVIYDDTTPFFVISRLPLPYSGSASTALCQKDDTDCDGNQDAMILTTGLTLANWTSKPITQVGWFLASYATTGGAWTFATDKTVGFNDNGFNQYWNFPVAQMGAAASTYMLANGGTAAIFTTNNYYYRIDKSGNVTCHFYLNADGGTDGVGAVTTEIALPYAIYEGTTSMDVRVNIGTAIGATTISSGANIVGVFLDLTTNMQLTYFSAATTQSAIQNAMFSNGARTINGEFTYPAMARIP